VTAVLAYCPNCNGEVKSSHVDDVGTQFYECQKCGLKTAKPKPIQRRKKEPSTTQQPTQYCGACVRFGTPKCTFRYGRIPTSKPKVVKDFREFLDWLYDFREVPVERYQTVTYPVLVGDHACVDFIPSTRR